MGMGGWGVPGRGGHSVSVRPTHTLVTVQLTLLLLLQASVQLTLLLLLLQTSVQLTLDHQSNAVRVLSRVKATSSTGVELEALTSASAAALTVSDMCKADSKDKDIEISNVQLEQKSGGLEQEGEVERGGAGAGGGAGRGAGAGGQGQGEEQKKREQVAPWDFGFRIAAGLLIMCVLSDLLDIAWYVWWLTCFQ